MSSRTRLIVMSISAPVIVFAIVGGFLGKVMAGQDTPYQHLKIFDDVVSMISSQYVEEVNIDKVMRGAMHGLADGLDPFLISEHLSWSAIEGVYLNDLMPLPYTEETLDLVVEHVDFVQARLGRRILVENPSAYLRFRHSPIPEAEFLAALVARSGCGLLCDINNIYVSGRNLGFDPIEYLAALPAAAIGEFHVAGHRANPVGDSVILIDDHGSAVADAVWALHGEALRRIGRRPALVEWDSRLPALDLLMAEADKADRLSKIVTPETDDVQAA